MGILDDFMFTINWILALWTVIGGPAIGLLIRSNRLTAGASSASATATAWVGGAAATAVIVALSYGLYLAMGLPAVWHVFVGR